MNISSKGKGYTMTNLKLVKTETFTINNKTFTVSLLKDTKYGHYTRNIESSDSDFNVSMDFARRKEALIRYNADIAKLKGMN